MVAADLSLDFLGSQQVDRTLVGLRTRVNDARPVWNVLADRFAKAEARQFRSEGAYGSGGWAPLSARYGAWKARVRPGRRILEFDGTLRRQLTERPFGVEVIEDDRMILGTALPYAQFHTTGTGTMPPRPPVELSEYERREWVKVMQRFIMTGDASPVARRRRPRT